MSHETGTYLGGVRTVEDMRQRCRIDSITGCWHWGLSIVCGAPKVHFVTPDTGRQISQRGRRAALYLQNGKDLGKDEVALPVEACDADDCVNPAHCTSGNRHALAAVLRARGKDCSPIRAAAAARSARKRAKITMEIAREIRASTESTYKVAERYGISQPTASAIRRGALWRESVAAANVFNLAEAA